MPPPAPVVLWRLRDHNTAMHALWLALALAAPARAVPEDAALMEAFKVRGVFEEMEAMKPRIDALAKELAALRESHQGKAEPDPGGPRRAALREELRRLLKELKKKRNEFKDTGVDNRLSQAITIAMRFKEGRNETANDAFQGSIRHAQIISEYKDYGHAIDVVMEDEERAYQDAVARWRLAEDARLRRRRLAQGGAAAAVGGLALAAALALLRRRAAAAQADDAAAAARVRLGRWKLVGAPRPWAFGTRWDTADGGAQTTASVRLFDEGLCAPPSSAAKLLAALKAAAPPPHPGLALPLEAFPAGSAAVLVYPPSAAKPLSVWLEEGRAIPPAKAVGFLKRLAPALDAAHARGRAHGGLAPDNVVVGADGTVVFEDFGVAAALAALGLPPAGSPAYAAPELEGAPPAPACDLYSLGVLLYELMTGRHPFEGTNLKAMKLEKRYTPLSRVVPGCPPAVDALLDGLLEPDPARRRPAPGSLAAALKAL